MKKFIAILSIMILTFSVPAFATTVTNGSYFAASSLRKQVFDSLFPPQILLEVNLWSDHQWVSPFIISDFDLRGKTIFFFIVTDDAQMLQAAPTNVRLWNNDNSSNEAAAEFIDYYSTFWAYDEYCKLTLFFYKFVVPDTWDYCNNIRFTKFYSSDPTARSLDHLDNVPYNFIASYDLQAVYISTPGSEETTNQLLQELVNQGTVGYDSNLDRIRLHCYYLNTDVHAILGLLEELVHGNESTSAAEEIVNSSEAAQLISDMQISKPDLSGSELDADNYVDQVAMTNASGILNLFFSQPLIATLLLIVLSMAVGSFLIFGRKG